MIAFQHVTFRLPDGRALLEGIDLEVFKGETLVLLGRSGCGKTTTMRMVNRLIDPSGGRLLVEGRPTTEWDAIQLRRRIGYVIQDAGLFPHYSVRENVALVPEMLEWPMDRIKARVDAMLELVGLEAETFGDRLPGALSGGQRQRVGIARALAADPPILLLDEPFSALDPITRRDIQHEFKNLQNRLGKTMIFVTHDVREALMLASRIALLKEGKLEFLGSPAEFLTNPGAEARAFVACLDEPSSKLALP